MRLRHTLSEYLIRTHKSPEQLFVDFDDDAGGTIDKVEFLAGLHMCGVEITFQQLKVIWETFKLDSKTKSRNTDDSSDIDERAWLHFLDNCNNNWTEESLRDNFLKILMRVQPDELTQLIAQCPKCQQKKPKKIPAALATPGGPVPQTTRVRSTIPHRLPVMKSTPTPPRPRGRSHPLETTTFGHNQVVMTQNRSKSALLPTPASLPTSASFPQARRRLHLGSAGLSNRKPAPVTSANGRLVLSQSLKLRKAAKETKAKMHDLQFDLQLAKSELLAATVDNGSRSSRTKGSSKSRIKVEPKKLRQLRTRVNLAERKIRGYRDWFISVQITLHAPN